MMYIIHMPRKARITVVGAVHHIMSRGIDGAPIFRNDADRTVFIDILRNQLIKSGYLLYAWALMPNHYHLVMRRSEYPLATCMRCINGGYAQYFRKRSSTRGYLFQDRFKSIVTQDQDYIEELVRYVHLNPIRAKICPSLDVLDDYPWCGHSVLMGRQKRSFQNTTDVLRRFGPTLQSQRKAYRAFLEQGLSNTKGILSIIQNANNEREDRHSTSCWVIGNRDFVQKAMAEQEIQRIRLAQHAREGVDIQEIAGRIAAAMKIDIAQLHNKGRNSAGSAARKLCAYSAHRHYGISVRTIADYFGISSPAVSQMLAPGELLMDEMHLAY